MKLFQFQRGGRSARGGFNLVEAALSLGLLSMGVLTLAPLLVVGMKSARTSRDERATIEIARTLEEEARQGTLAPGPVYADSNGLALGGPTGAAYTVQPTTKALAGSISRLTLRVTPIGAPDRVRVYAVVYSSAPQP